MANISRHFCNKLSLALDKCKVEIDSDKNTLVFERSGGYYSHKLALNVSDLKKSEVKELAELINFVSSLISLATSAHERDVETLLLNTSNVESTQYLRRVLNFHSWSNAHKLALLVSGAIAIDTLGLERTWQLATMKTDPKNDWRIRALEFKSKPDLLKWYLLPGVGSFDSTYTIGWKSVFNDLTVLYDPKTVALANFLSLKNSKKTLREQFNNDEMKTLETFENLKDFDLLEASLKFAKLNNFEYVLDLNPDQFRFLISVTPGMSDYPIEILAKRLLSLGDEVKILNEEVNTPFKSVSTIDRLINSKERFGLLKEVSELKRHYEKSGIAVNVRTALMIVVAQIFVERGLEKATEVIDVLSDLSGEISPIGLETNIRNELIASLASLAAESLNPDNADYPFAWVCQTSKSHNVISELHKELMDDKKEREGLYLSMPYRSLFTSIQSVSQLPTSMGTATIPSNVALVKLNETLKNSYPSL